jgi:serine/threonine-protein kinase
LAVNPWGEVYVDGRKRGLSPPTKELRLPPGRHQVEIRNGTFPSHVETIEVNADEAVRITHSF